MAGISRISQSRLALCDEENETQRRTSLRSHGEYLPAMLGPGPHHVWLGSLPAIPWAPKVFQSKSLCLHPQKSSVELRGHWKKRSEMPLAEAPALRGREGLRP